jgi:hypothetical protein
MAGNTLLLLPYVLPHGVEAARALPGRARAFLAITLHPPELIFKAARWFMRNYQPQPSLFSSRCPHRLTSASPLSNCRHIRCPPSRPLTGQQLARVIRHVKSTTKAIVMAIIPAIIGAHISHVRASHAPLCLAGAGCVYAGRTGGGGVCVRAWACAHACSRDCSEVKQNRPRPAGLAVAMLCDLRVAAADATMGRRVEKADRQIGRQTQADRQRDRPRGRYRRP